MSYKHYLTLHMNAGIKEGDFVKVTRRAFAYEKGWVNTWTEEMDAAIGNTYEVTRDDGKSGLQLSFHDGDFDFPCFVLEKVDKSDEKTTKIEKEREMEIGDVVYIRRGAPIAWCIGQRVVLRKAEGLAEENKEVIHSDGETVVLKEEDGYHITAFINDVVLVRAALKPHDRLIEFMNEKARIIAVRSEGRVRDYFLPEDEAAIREWSREDAEEVVSRLRVSANCLGIDSCQFCIYYLQLHRDVTDDPCLACSYGERHKMCVAEANSTWKRATRFVTMNEKDRVVLKAILSRMEVCK